jgi:DegV family protein with EDD domain
MSTVIVTDSTCDIPIEIIEKLNIYVVPCSVNFGVDTYLDGVEIKAEEFYKRLTSSEIFPTTSQPTPNQFLEIYNSIPVDSDILSIHVSEKLSGTYNSAMQAKKTLEDRKIEVIDSQLASTALGLVVIEAANLAQEEKSLEEIVQKTRESLTNSNIYILLDTIEYLKRGGRIGKAQAFVGNLLKLRPILTLNNGAVAGVKKTRSKQAGMKYLQEILIQKTNLLRVAVLYTTNKQEALEVANNIQEITNISDVIISQCGPAIGAHAGPGAVGIALLNG